MELGGSDSGVDENWAERVDPSLLSLKGFVEGI